MKEAEYLEVILVFLLMKLLCFYFRFEDKINKETRPYSIA